MNSKQRTVNSKQGKKQMVLTILLTIYCLLFTNPASAHILKTNGNIGVLLHLNPEDDPYIGEPASFFFEIKDKQNKFNPQDCNCKISIKKESTELFSGDIFSNNMANNISSTVFSYTFRERGLYRVEVTGTPKENSFQAFNVQYDLRITRDRRVSTSTDNYNFIVWAGLGILAAVSLAIIYLRSSKSRKGNK